MRKPIPPAAWKWFTSAQPVRIDARQQRHRFRKVGDVLPGEAIPAAAAIAIRWIVWLVDPPVACRPTTRVDDRALVDHAANGRIVVAERGKGQGALRRLLGERIAQRRAGVDERGSGRCRPMISISIWLELAVP